MLVCVLYACIPTTNVIRRNYVKVQKQKCKAIYAHKGVPRKNQKIEQRTGKWVLNSQHLPRRTKVGRNFST
jgi:hypothetical protein